MDISTHTWSCTIFHSFGAALLYMLYVQYTFQIFNILCNQDSSLVHYCLPTSYEGISLKIVFVTTTSLELVNLPSTYDGVCLKPLGSASGVVVSVGVEPTTYSVSANYSNHLSCQLHPPKGGRLNKRD